MIIFRNGIPVTVPESYGTQPEHLAVVEQLTKASRYVTAVEIIEAHVTSYLAADVITGQDWAARYLLTTARLNQSISAQDRLLGRRGARALWAILTGVRQRGGRQKAPPMSPEQLGIASSILSRWRAQIDALWGQDRATFVSGLLSAAPASWTPSGAHRRALRALVRRRGIRKSDIAVTLTSWETGIPIRRLRGAGTVADLVYG